MNNQTRKVAYTVVLAAISIALSPLSIPIGAAKVFPWQAMVNVLAAVLVGPWYALIAALVASLVRNSIGTGTLFAFPGSMIGAFLAGLLFRYTRSTYLAGLGEIIGSGIIGALVSTIIWAPMVMGRNMEAFAMLGPFLIAVVPGAVLGVVAAKLLERAGVVTRSERPPQPIQPV